MRLPTAGGAPIRVVQATQDRDRAQRSGTARCLLWGRLRERLPEALVRPRAVAVRHVLAEHAGPLPLAKDEQVIQAHAADAPQEALADGDGLRRPGWRAQDRDPAGCGDGRERGPERAVVIADEVARALVEGVASRRCWATQASVGWRVAPTWTTRRVACSMMKKAHSGRERRSVTGRKSHAQLSGAWLRRKVAHVCPRGRGARRPRS